MARSLSGTAQYFSTGATSNITGDFTLALWIKTSSSTLAVGMGFYHPSSTSLGWGMGYSIATAGKLSLWDGAAWREQTSTMNSGNWEHYAVTVQNGSGVAHYKNGAADGTNFAGTLGSNPTAAKVIGAVSDGSSPITAQFAEICIWDGILLSTDNIAGLAKGVSPLTVRPASIHSYWPMFGRAGASGDEVDFVGGRNGTVTGSPTVTDHPPRVHYPARRRLYIPAAAAAASASPNFLTLLGVGA